VGLQSQLLKKAADLQLPAVQEQRDGVLFWKITNGSRDALVQRHSGAAALADRAPPENAETERRGTGPPALVAAIAAMTAISGGASCADHRMVR
jgi:hypothetical protein